MKFFSKDKSVVKQLKSATVGGVTIEGEGELRVAMAGENLQMTYVELEPGYFHPMHRHPDNESIGYVFSGKIKMTIDGIDHILQAGDVWIHPRNVWHETRCLEKATFLEMHTPARDDFKDLWAQNEANESAKEA